MDWNIEVVVIPVSDVDRAKHFYADQCGFTVDHDTHISDDVRIVQLTPPGSGCSIVISSGMTSMPPGSIQGIQIVLSDVEAARAQLAAAGVAVTPVRRTEGGEWFDGPGGDWNAFVFFSDPDGNSWTLQQHPPR